MDRLNRRAALGFFAVGALAALGAEQGWRRLGARKPRQGAPEAIPAVAPGPVDIGFAQSMSAHHDQAITLARILLSKGESRLAVVARSVQTSQLVEIGEMKGWLKMGSQPLLPTRTGMNWMLEAPGAADPEVLKYVALCSSSPSSMPGLASTDELNRLRELTANERDAFFLQLMVRHHEGALPMARVGAHHAQVPAVRMLASQMVFDQTLEIGRMKAFQGELAVHPADARSS